MESIEKHLTYSDITKLPPQPIPQINTNTNTQNNTKAITNKAHIKQKNDNLTIEEIMDRSKKMVGIYPINSKDIERNKAENKTQTLMNTVTEFLKDELESRQDQIQEMNITTVTKTKKADRKTLYVTFPDYTSVTQIFKRTALIKNENLKISNYIAPHFYNRYNTLHSYCKKARENNNQLRT